MSYDMRERTFEQSLTHRRGCNRRGAPPGEARARLSSTFSKELLFREFEQACEQSGACRMLQQQGNSITKVRCIRECVSPSCYQEIYLPDQLEEGEIDVRLNSFKGCFMQRSGRPRK
ncbi:uncharacterized protein LOC107228024 isoform X2 [Neodiprion lecontei]|uniref:Uncharacterized protein LOC107228024 isoform X2 n=1 Tax=Neodiprion lecontei TaxID=441921 RepID=A0ABM3G6Z0_NEOLC|nr:uncharacterized protein LOC107228024 isoform X2 [Neodiprion lecontei]